ncbi:hypothetical protein [Paenibacillus sp. YN15]|uniref:hypothetical protein n=1 Tax=Paenibacillus sp. YN15 TaxID=1742774 RepID=UPI000DCE0E38|nr:hypothetical protein [Paenibacillus sp. YN15]RAU93211.1 hypothetical protein DQG13_26150 [Paenibacillus sp. YN15]
MKLTAVLSLTDNYTDTLKHAIKKTQEFRDETEKTRKALENTNRKKYELDVEVSQAVANLNEIHQTLVMMKSTTINVQFQTNNFNQVINQQNQVAQKQNKLVEAGKKLATSAISGVIKLLKLAVQPLSFMLRKTADLVSSSLRGAAAFERSSMSVEHTIAVNNKGLSPEAIKKKAADYMSTYRKAAELTSFDTEDVQKAGTRAIAMAMGDTQEATNLLRLAGDMAALTPGKSLEDALGALMELKKGDGGSMDDFGFFTTESRVKAAGNDMGKVTDRNGIKLNDMFRGGGEQAGESAEGLWKSITNSMKNGIEDMGKDTLTALKPEMKKWAAFFRSDGFQKMIAAGSNIMSGLAKGIAERSASLRGWFESTFFNNEEFANLSLKGKFLYVLDEMKKGFDDWFETEGKGIFQKIVSVGSQVLADSAIKFSEVGVTIGKSLAKGMVDGLGEVAKDHPVLSSLTVGAAATAVGGPAVGAVTAGTTLVVSSVGGFMDRVEERKKTRELEKQAAWEKSKNSTPETPFLPNTTLSGKPKDRTFLHDGRDWLWNHLIDMGLMDVPKPKAIGLPRVPYDNYPALLHQNERVLTAQEARSMDRTGSPVVINLTAGKTVDPDIGRLMAALRSAVEAAGFNMAPGGATA